MVKFTVTSSPCAPIPPGILVPEASSDRNDSRGDTLEVCPDDELKKSASKEEKEKSLQSLRRGEGTSYFGCGFESRQQ